MGILKTSISVLLSLCLATAPSLAQEGARAVDSEAFAVGQVEFQTSCGSCHGADAKGHGPVSPFLTLKPSDLTQLSARNDGVFPREAVFETIDGRNGVGVHGGRTMPVWGARYVKEFEMFGGVQDDSALAEARIARLVAFLAAIQN